MALFTCFKSVKRLSTEEKNKSFVGSDFSISDIAGRFLKILKILMLNFLCLLKLIFMIEKTNFLRLSPIKK